MQGCLFVLLSLACWLWQSREGQGRGALCGVEYRVGKDRIDKSWMCKGGKGRVRQGWVLVYLIIHYTMHYHSPSVHPPLCSHANQPLISPLTNPTPPPLVTTHLHDHTHINTTHALHYSFFHSHNIYSSTTLSSTLICHSTRSPSRAPQSLVTAGDGRDDGR